MADPEDVPGLQALVVDLRAQITALEEKIAQYDALLFPPGSAARNNIEIES